MFFCVTYNFQVPCLAENIRKFGKRNPKQLIVNKPEQEPQINGFWSENSETDINNSKNNIKRVMNVVRAN